MRERVEERGSFRTDPDKPLSIEVLYESAHPSNKCSQPKRNEKISCGCDGKRPGHVEECPMTITNITI